MRAAHPSAEESPNVDSSSSLRRHVQRSAREPFSLDLIETAQVDWREFDSFADRNVYQTRDWLSFVAETQKAKPAVALMKRGDEIVGLFTGLIKSRYQIRILGSPFPGWTTAYLGFNLRDGVSRRAAVKALLPFAFENLHCLHLELRDRQLRAQDVEGLGFTYSRKAIFEVDLRRTEDEIFMGMTSACRRCIRKAEKVGVVIEEATDLGFADDYHAQLRDVFAKQRLVPSYDVSRVRGLIRHLQPSGNLLLLRARSSEGKCIATGIFPALNKTAHFWGGASWREHQILRPNEALMWYAIRYWKARGIEQMDLGGGAEYKRKYGVVEVPVPSFRISRFWFISVARRLGKREFRLRQMAHGRAASSRREPASDA